MSRVEEGHDAAEEKPRVFVLAVDRRKSLRLFLFPIFLILCVLVSFESPQFASVRFDDPATRLIARSVLGTIGFAAVIALGRMLLQMVVPVPLLVIASDGMRMPWRIWDRYIAWDEIVSISEVLYRPPGWRARISLPTVTVTYRNRRHLGMWDRYRGIELADVREELVQVWLRERSRSPGDR